MNADKPWLICLRPNEQASLRLVCLPYAGGGPPVFRKWPQMVPSNVEVWAGQYPGRGRRFSEPLVTEMAPVVTAIAGTLADWDVPWLIFGHSLGALVSFEVVRLLRRWQQHHYLAALMVSACRAPHLPLGRSPIANLPDSELLAALRRLNGIPEELLANQEILDLLLPAIRSDIGLAEQYEYRDEAPLQYEAALECPIFAFGGRQDPEVSLVALTGWQLHTMAEFRLQLFAGDHFYINQQLDSLLAVIGRQLGNLLLGLKES